MKPTNQIDILEYVEIVLRHKWLIILPFVLVASLGAVYSKLPPDIYRASTLILVEQQKVPEAYIQSIVTSTVNERLRTIRQQIMSRTMLERIINEFDLYGEIRESTTIEGLVTKMRSNIELDVQSARRGSSSTFELFYQGKDPKTVAMIANKLASLFIEENLKVREQQAEGTTEFLAVELNRIRKELESKEEAIRTFKQKHMGELPGELDTILRGLDRFQLQVQTNGEAMRAAENREVLLQRQLAEMTSTLITSGESGTGHAIRSVSPRTQLVGLRQDLQDLKVRYTEKHPEVIRVEKEIRVLETKLMKESEEEGTEDAGPAMVSSSDPVYYDLRNQLAETRLDIRRMKDEERRLKREIAKYQKRVEKIPNHEQQLVTLTRDYDNIEENYQSILNRKLDAQLSANMERKQKGEQFKILDPARIPERPFKPDRRKILLVSLILGLGIGGGLAFVAEYMDHSFRDSKELEEFANLPVIASIPRIITEGDKERKRVRRRIAYASSSVILLIMIVTATIHLFIFRLDFFSKGLHNARKVLFP